MSVSICLAGNGWGAVAAFESLRDFFSDITVVTSDNDLTKLAFDSGCAVLPDLDDVEADLIICAGYKRIVPNSFLQKKTVLNIHYSLLPKYRGLHSIVWAILNGESELGLSVHLMDSNVDGGAIVHQYSVKYFDQDSAEIMRILNGYVRNNLSVIVNNYINDKNNIHEQDFSKATWVCKRNLTDCFINYDWNVEFFKRFFKALVAPYPLPRFEVDGVCYEILSAKFVCKKYYMQNGRVVNIDGYGVWVKIEDGFLVIKEIRNADNHNHVDIINLFKVGMRLK